MEWRFHGLYGVCSKYNIQDRVFTRERDDDRPLSVRLMAARVCAKYSKEELARLLGIHRTSVLRYETEAFRTIDRERLAEWARLCEVSEEWLLKGGPTKSKRLDVFTDNEYERRAGYPV